MMLRKFFAFLVLSFVLLVAPRSALADEDFDISTAARYTVSTSGNTQVAQTITIRNKKEFVYTPSYSISTGITDIRNLKAYDTEGSLSTNLITNEDSKTIEINFSKRVVGIDATNTFTVSFDTSEIAKNIGSIWEIIVPGLENPGGYSVYQVVLSVPESFGPPAISKPSKKLVYPGSFTFSKDEVGRGGILITFGKSQYYKLELKYTIANAKVYPIKTEIALPPNTSYQDVRIESLNPAPFDVYRDEDGNYLAVYNLNPNEVKTINANMLVRVFAIPTFDIKDPKGEFGAQDFWEAENTRLKKLANELATPDKIYEYVVNNLSYNYDKIGDSNERLGAVGAMNRPDYAVCLEFTDLFVALARAAGIPARAVEGYAYTGNSKLRPLSLVQDILHAWPEYYDETRKAWIMVDPTWGNTTGGMDYFNTFDFDHIAFVVKGASSTYPVPAGGYKLTKHSSKDVEVGFAKQEDFQDKINSTLTAVFPKYALSGFPATGQVIIENKGNMELAAKRANVESDLLSETREFYIDVIPPYGKKVLTVDFPKTPFLTNREYEVRILFDGSEIKKSIRVGLFPDPFLILLGGVIICGSIIISYATWKTWNIYIQKRKKQSSLRRQGKRPS